MNVKDIRINYQLKRQREAFATGNDAAGVPIELELECLQSLDETIDHVFAILEKLGNPQALEQLCPYFGVVWPAARGLAEYLARLPEGELAERSVLELGCGLAVPGIVAAKRGARVVASDCHPAVPDFLERNLKLNSAKVAYREVNWEAEDADSSLGQFEWVIGSDILYERRFPEALARSIARFVGPGGRVVIGDPGRPYLQTFADAMRALGFGCETLIIHEVFVLSFLRNPL